jgi:hypothetical protein
MYLEWQFEHVNRGCASPVAHSEGEVRQDCGWYEMMSLKCHARTLEVVRSDTLRICGTPRQYS